MEILHISFKSHLIYPCVAVLGLHCCTGFSRVVACGGCSGRGARASHGGGVSGCGAWALGRAGSSSRSSRALARWLRRCDASALLLHGVWDLLRSGVELVSAALAGGFFTTEAPGGPNTVCILLGLLPSTFWCVS